MNTDSLSPVVGGLWGTVAHISFDVVVIMLLFLGFAALSFYFGKSKSIALIVAGYLALFLYTTFPFLKNSATQPTIVIGVFVLIWLFLFVILKKVFYSEFPYSLLKKIFEAALFSLSLLILLLVASYHYLPVDELYHFSNLIAPLFTPTQYVFYWLSAPPVIIFLTSRR